MIEITTRPVRGIQVYTPKSRRPEYGKAVQLALGWLAAAQLQATEDRAFQLLGLIWGQAKPEVIRNAQKRLSSTVFAESGS